MPPLRAEGALVIASASSFDKCIWRSFASHDGEMVFIHVFFDKVVTWIWQILQVAIKGREGLSTICPLFLKDRGVQNLSCFPIMF